MDIALPPPDSKKPVHEVVVDPVNGLEEDEVEELVRRGDAASFRTLADAYIQVFRVYRVYRATRKPAY